MDPFGISGESAYAAVTGDLVASRGASQADRQEVQRVALEVVAALNRELADHLARPFVLTAGDEIQGLLRTPSKVARVVQELKDRLYGSAAPNLEIAFGVGWGPLSTGLMPEAESVEHLDGPCFHHARDMLGLAKKNKAWVLFHGFGDLADRTLNALFELMAAIRAGWTPTQSWYTVEMRALDKRIDVARKCNVSPSVVTESLQASRYDAIIHGEETAALILGRFDPEAPRASAG